MDYKIIWAALVLGALALIQPVFSEIQAERSVWLNKYMPGEVVAKLRSDLLTVQNPTQIKTLIEHYLGDDIVDSIKPFQTDRQTQLIRLKGGKDAAMMAQELARSPLVEYAEPNYIYRTSETAATNDPLLNKLWGLINVGQADDEGKRGLVGADIHVLPLWKEGITGSKEVVVAIIDTGMDWSHPDLAGNLYFNPGEKDANGIDDDGNGFIDDIHGWNFVHNNNKTNQGDTMHGTHVSGTIGAVGNNGIGVVGVNWKVSLLPVKALDGSGGTLANAVEAINYARMMKANVMSNSWGAQFYSQALEEAVLKVRDAGITFVVAAGNAGGSSIVVPHYPANTNAENVISVAATDNRDQLADFSNFRGESFMSPLQESMCIVRCRRVSTSHIAELRWLRLTSRVSWHFYFLKSLLSLRSKSETG